MTVSEAIGICAYVDRAYASGFRDMAVFFESWSYSDTEFDCSHSVYDTMAKVRGFLSESLSVV